MVGKKRGGIGAERMTQRIKESVQRIKENKHFGRHDPEYKDVLRLRKAGIKVLRFKSKETNTNKPTTRFKYYVEQNWKQKMEEKANAIQRGILQVLPRLQSTHTAQQRVL